MTSDAQRTQTPPQKIAVIGAGFGGLAATYHLLVSLNLVSFAEVGAVASA